MQGIWTPNEGKVEKILKGSLDSIPSPSPSVKIQIMVKLQSLTGKYRGLQGNPCNENRDPAMRTGVPCNENRFFPAGIDSQGVPCEQGLGLQCELGYLILYLKPPCILGTPQPLTAKVLTVC